MPFSLCTERARGKTVPLFPTVFSFSQKVEQQENAGKPSFSAFKGLCKYIKNTLCRFSTLSENYKLKSFRIFPICLKHRSQKMTVNYILCKELRWKKPHVSALVLVLSTPFTAAFMYITFIGFYCLLINDSGDREVKNSRLPHGQTYVFLNKIIIKFSSNIIYHQH